VPASPEELAQIAYRAYGESTDFLNFRGEPMPDWGNLGDRIQTAWILAAQAVAEHTRQEADRG
jgi:hypothetical protein